MENLETQQRVIKLGEKIVNELGLDPGVDTLSKWMAHYVAEKIEAIDSVEESRVDETRRECFDLILNLWHCHGNHPRNKSPFERFEMIYSAIEKIDPEIQTPYHKGLSSLYTEDDREAINSESQKWVNHAIQIDSINREIINFLHFLISIRLNL